MLLGLYRGVRGPGPDTLRGIAIAGFDNETWTACRPARVRGHSGARGMGEGQVLRTCCGGVIELTEAVS